jgi:hypothetical protein
MANYTVDDDLAKKRSNILDLGIASFDDQHGDTKRILDRDLMIWYEAEAQLRGRDSRSIPFEQQYLLEADVEIKPAAVFLALSLAYDKLAKDLPAEADGMAAQREHYRKEFDREWGSAKLVGFSYDWNKSGEMDADELPQVNYRTLVRQ